MQRSSGVTRRCLPLLWNVGIRRFSRVYTTVTIFDSTLRDGIQGINEQLPTDKKIEVLDYLEESGIENIEFGAFVKRVRQMEDSKEIANILRPRKKKKYWALIANRKGYIAARESGVKSIAIAASVSEIFAKKNINRTVRESVIEFGDIIKSAKKKNVNTRVYLSCALGSPYQEVITSKKVAEVALQFIQAGTDEVVPSDTTGMGNPQRVLDTTKALIGSGIHARKIAWHFHGKHPEVDQNILAALTYGVRKFDASIGWGKLGGCPFAPAHYGNISTERLVKLLDSEGFETGIKLESLQKAWDVVRSSLLT